MASLRIAVKQVAKPRGSAEAYICPKALLLSYNTWPSLEAIFAIQYNTIQNHRGRKEGRKEMNGTMISSSNTSVRRDATHNVNAHNSKISVVSTPRPIQQHTTTPSDPTRHAHMHEKQDVVKDLITYRTRRPELVCPWTSNLALFPSLSSPPQATVGSSCECEWSSRRLQDVLGFKWHADRNLAKWGTRLRWCPAAEPRRARSKPGGGPARDGGGEISHLRSLFVWRPGSRRETTL